MRRIRRYLDSLSESVTLTKKEKLMGILIAGLTGMVLGMLLSPRRTLRVCCGNNNGNNVLPDAALDNCGVTFPSDSMLDVPEDSDKEQKKGKE